MFLLSLDTCDGRGSVAVLRDESVLSTVSHETEEDYSSWLLPAVTRALEAANVVLAAIDTYAVAAGPGSFTGLRVGLTTVKAWSEIYGKPIAAVSRLEALAVQVHSNAPYVAAFTDANRGQVFGCLYSRVDSKLQQVEEEMVIAPESFVVYAIARSKDKRIQWVSPDPKCVAETNAWAARRDLGETVLVIAPVLAPIIGRLGYQQAVDNRLTSSLALDANYVRRSDAEIFWKGPPSHGQ
jgi:tRNA threonylcarbamoyladenosine biosynthesis protein TsaB